jgi:choline dehydrogenase
VGVHYVYNGSNAASVRANKEVLVAAGTIGSAKLLMLSGVGPSEHLNQLEVCTET